MSDDKNKKDFRDRTRIDPEAKYEVQYWSNKLGVTGEQLKQAIKKAGPMVKDVEKALKGK